MIKHYVMFQLRTDLAEAERREAAEQFKKSIEALPEVIPVIRNIRVHLNINPKETWHICLDSTFASMDDLALYSQHPAHVAAAKALMARVAQRACVDAVQETAEEAVWP